MLKDLLYKVNIQSVYGSTSIEVGGLNTDSRLIKPGECFIAIKGTLTDGHNFIETAISNGASSIVCEKLPEQLNDNVTYVEVLNSSIACGLMANLFYGEPSSKLKLVGVTGTNGKTTVATLLYKLFSSLDYTCGLISTVKTVIGENAVPSTHTTPDSISLNKILREMVDSGCTYVFMECSSHAIHQHRIASLQFAGAIFTNITLDHLDYHGTFNEYINVKKSWFDSLSPSSFALSNADDKRGMVMLQNTKASKYFYSLKTFTDYKGKILDNTFDGLQMIVNEVDVHFKMIGEFNAYNLLAVFGAAMCLKQDKLEVLRILSELSGAEGRFDNFRSSGNNITGIVDYAHTPDALLNVLATIKKIKNGPEKIITVVGCGGNRDASKRPIMAQVACEYSDQVILTSDNPRNEDPDEILREMNTGVDAVCRKKVMTISDRKEAIKVAVNVAGENDIILVAGKGHEKYQEIKGVKNHFDDKEVLEEMFVLLNK